MEKGNNYHKNRSVNAVYVFINSETKFDPLMLMLDFIINLLWKVFGWNYQAVKGDFPQICWLVSDFVEQDRHSYHTAALLTQDIKSLMFHISKLSLYIKPIMSLSIRSWRNSTRAPSPNYLYIAVNILENSFHVKIER